MNGLSAKEKNYLNSVYYSFELGADGVYIQHPEVWSISNEKDASNGNYSLKYESSSPATGVSKVNIGKDDALVSFPAGDYTFKVKVWLSANSEITGFRFILKEPWKVITVNFPSDIKKEEWVEISLPLTGIEEYQKSAVLFKMEPEFGGKGTLYIDDIGIWGIDNTPENIPNLSSIQTEENTISLPAGNYEVSVNVWVDENTSISKFHTIIKQPWINLEWDLSSVAKSAWVTLTQSMQVNEDISESPFIIQLSNLPEYGGGKGAFYIDDIKFDISTGLKKQIPIDFDFKVYPNPASDWLKIDASEHVDFVLYSISGKIVLLSSQKKRHHRVQVSKQKAGVYLLQIKSNKGSVVKSIILQ